MEVADNVDPDKPLEQAPEEEAEEEVEPIEVPPAVYRDFVEATDLKTVEYPVFDRVKIPSYSISKGGFLSSDYCLFLVETEQGKERLRVKRRDNDFYLLRQSLKAQFPYVMVPPLPKVNKKLTDAILQKRQRFFQRFLQAINRSEILRTSQFWGDFITLKDMKEWEQAIKTSQKLKHSRAIKDFLTADGQANVQMLQSTVVWLAKMPEYIKQQQILFQEFIDVGKEVNQKCQHLNASFINLADCFSRISELYQIIDLPHASDLFEQLALVLDGTGENILNTGEMINLYCGSGQMKYHLVE